MIAIENYTVKYFKTPKDYFWQWAEKGTVLEWQNGATICYSDDLFDLLRQISNKGLPPLSALLLLLTACKRPLDPQEIMILGRNSTAFKNSASEAENEPLKIIFKEAVSFLAIVAGLPENLRTGQKRLQLLFEIFSDGNFTIGNRQLQDALQELGSGRFDKTVFDFLAESISEKEYKGHLQYFSNAFKKYPTVQQLVVKLRTGLDQLPNALDIELPEANPLNIFDELLQDPATVGVARLAKRLMATLNIPMQSKGSSDQPFGGISDITNRGNYDKLLLSELAYDDELLMARFVNNEALYFKREQPPEQPKVQRVILIDTTIKMWGTSRVFALAAGLASAQNNKHSALLQAYCLGGADYTTVNLNVKPGVIQALERLDHALHCGKSLEAVIQSISSNTNNEIIFITDAKLLHSPAFHVSLAAVRTALSFVITVSNNGSLNLYEYTNGVSKQIGSAVIDVNELLSGKVDVVKKVRREHNNIPLFLSYSPSPLLYAPFRIKISPEKTFVEVESDFGAVAVSEGQRVFFINQQGKAVYEILNYIEKGDYSFWKDTHNNINILVSNKERYLLKLYKVNSENFETKSINLSDEMPFYKWTIYKEDLLYVQTENATFTYDCIAEIVIKKDAVNAFNQLTAVPKMSLEKLRKLISLKKYSLKNETIFYRVNHMYLNNNNQLVVGNHCIVSYLKSHISFRQQESENNRHTHAKLSEETLYLVQNKNVKFNVWIWKDGSEAVVDSRGMLHLKSSNGSLPEITIVMTINRTTACWASDGTAAGSLYFINEKITRVISAEDFYAMYIQKYINQLI